MRAWPARSAPAAAAVAQAAQQHARQQRGVDVVADGVGHRQVQGVAVEGVVERVAADGVRRLQPAGDGEPVGLARVGPGQQPPLDLRGQRERRRVLRPVHEVGVPPAGDDHPGQRLGDGGDVGEDQLVGVAGQVQVDHAEGVAALRDRHEDALAAPLVEPHDPLAAQHLLVDRAAQREDRDVAVLLLHPGRVRVGSGEAHHGPVRDVRDQELDVRRPGQGGEAVGHHVDGLHGRRRARLSQYVAQVDPRAVGNRHNRTLRPVEAGSIDRSSQQIVVSRLNAPAAPNPRPLCPLR